MVLTQAIEDYLKTIYRLDPERNGVSTNNIANAMNVSSASVTNMVKRLDNMKLATYQSYQGTFLTDAGEKIALEIIRHHRLLELYLTNIMNYSWDEVHEEAEHLEHHISEQFEDKIAELLDNPTHDPHGDPIPSKEGVMPKTNEQSLIHVEENNPMLIVRVKDQEPERLRYLEQEGLLPGATLIVRKKAPFEGPLSLNVNKTEKVIGYNLAKTIQVAPLS